MALPNIQVRKTIPIRWGFKNICQVGNLFHTFSAITQSVTLHLELLSLNLLQKCEVNLSPFNLSPF